MWEWERKKIENVKVGSRLLLIEEMKYGTHTLPSSIREIEKSRKKKEKIENRKIGIRN